MTPPAEYGLLVELAERERELIATGALDELAELDAERAALTSALPAVPPADARGALERALALQETNTAALVAAIGDTRREILDLGGHRVAARGYAPTVGGGALVDRRAG